MAVRTASARGRLDSSSRFHDGWRHPVSSMFLRRPAVSRDGEPAQERAALDAVTGRAAAAIGVGIGQAKTEMVGVESWMDLALLAGTVGIGDLDHLLAENEVAFEHYAIG